MMFAARERLRDRFITIYISKRFHSVTVDMVRKRFKLKLIKDEAPGDSFAMATRKFDFKDSELTITARSCTWLVAWVAANTKTSAVLNTCYRDVIRIIGVALVSTS